MNFGEWTKYLVMAKIPEIYARYPCKLYEVNNLSNIVIIKFEREFDSLGLS